MQAAEKQSIERQEDFNQVIAGEMANLLRASDQHRDLMHVATLMRDPMTMKRFLGDKVGPEFFTQNIRMDAKAVDLATSALARLYEASNGRPMEEEELDKAA